MPSVPQLLIILVIVVLYMIINLLVDLAYARLDPETGALVARV